MHFKLQHLEIQENAERLSINRDINTVQSTAEGECQWRQQKGEKGMAYHQQGQQIWILRQESRPEDRQKVDQKTITQYRKSACSTAPTVCSQAQQQSRYCSEGALSHTAQFSICPRSVHETPIYNVSSLRDLEQTRPLYPEHTSSALSKRDTSRTWSPVPTSIFNKMPVAGRTLL